MFKMVIVISDKKGNFENCLKELLCDFGIGNTDSCKIEILNQNTKTEQFKNGTVGICSESSLKGLKLLKKSGIPIISCGMGRKNTLTVSSNEPEYLMLCLQRSITDISGELLEPCEIKMAKKRCSDIYSYLCTAAVMLLYGIRNDDSFIW